MPQSITPTRTEPVFVSKSPNLRVVRSQELVDHFPNGTQRQIAPSLDYQFESGTLRVDDALRARDEAYIKRYRQHLVPDDLQAEDVGDEFLSTDEWLRQRGEKTGNFWEMPVPIPEATPVMREIAECLVREDLDRIAEIYDEEQHTHERADVLDTCIIALRKAEEPAGTG